MRILGICGNMKPYSATAAVLKLSLEASARAGSDISFYDIAEHPLPFCDARDDESTYPPEVHEFRKQVRDSQGIILATPDYHNSFSGSLKNALDLCSSEEFDHKIIGIIGVAGGGAGAINAITQLRTVMRSVGAWVIPHQVSIAHSSSLFSAANTIADPSVAKRVEKLGADVVKYANLFAKGLLEEL
ncbi:MAG TPA: NADPH-dependent FMN reductase [Candidatus Kapabacteria bacterium]|nr:NADPH-dependent FMN reductase [Candidatus Kapabacteria bacterium]